MQFTFKLRRGNAAQWTAVNPILAEGEPGVEVDTDKFKIGNGVDHWNDLAYYLSETSINTYIDAEVAEIDIGDTQFPDLIPRWESATA